MARQDVGGIEIDYEFFGDEKAPVIILTPGGRYPRDTPGLPQLAAALVQGGYRVLSWDRPNCGASDVSFEGTSESVLHADTLVGLTTALGLDRFALAGGSAGSRISLMAAARVPEKVSKLFIWWISGGAISLAQLANYYCADAAAAATRGGMEAVLVGFADQIARNPNNRELILKWKPEDFIARMQLWAEGYAYSRTSPVPGISAEQFARMTMPAIVLHSGKSDLSHTREASEQTASLLPNAQLLEPPWPDQEWNNCSKIPNEPGRGRFERWPLLAPMILEFLNA
ncbi:MAG TPA: alpha/beta hydrolase [Acidocella sp.]|jgi:pimeloyl-ACP methyl ester carboxylesterase|nr:alpha/beta hydrolase [Acidocella sp.]